MRKRFISSLLLAALLAGGAQAGTVFDSLRTTVYYRTASARLELPFMDNASRLNALADSLRGLGADPAVTLRRIRILSSASPEGNTSFNEHLSVRRGEELRDYLKRSLSLPDSVFTLRSAGEDWEGLTRLVENTRTPWRERALHILRHTPQWVTRGGKVVDGRKRQLMNLSGGRAWQYMKEHLFDSLRSGALVVCEMERVERPQPQPVNTPAEVTPAPEVADTPAPVQPEPATEALPADSRKSFYMAAKTNLLYDAALVPNVGLEFSLGKGWSIGGRWMYAWWSRDSRHRYYRVYGGELDIRKYFGRKAAEKPLQGHHLGLYAQGLTYDLEKGGRGNLAHFAYGAGVEYGYSLPVARRLNFDFGLGIGYSGGTYKEYRPEDGCYVYKETKRRRWFGPTRAEISLVWLLGHGNSNKQKGGTK